MKEVKIVKLSELIASSKWSSWSYIVANDAGKEGMEDMDERANSDRLEVEQRIADLLNDGWQIEGTGGERLGDAYFILVRECQE